MSIARTSPTPQMQASDPAHSAWVSANAGSGKTTVLVWRVIRLLLDGVKPARILCLTYTKAAAANMANRTLSTLRDWVQLDDGELDKELARFDPTPASAERRQKARRLFAAALETPGGLKVQTIHAFCDSVLHMFPVESQVPAGFEVLDDAGERDLLAQARLDTLGAAGEQPESGLGRALSHVIAQVDDDRLQAVLMEAVRARASLSLERTNDEAIAKALNASRAVAEIEHDILDGPVFPRAAWSGTAQEMMERFAAKGKGNAFKCAGLFQAAAAAGDSEAFDAYLEIFVTGQGTLKADATFGSEADLKAIPGLREKLFAERERLESLIEQLRAARERERSAALFRIAADVIKRYEAAKQARGVLDFADLVTKTVAMLDREESAWVHYKLDGGIDHILVDEAQDTSPEQWHIVGKLAEEFFAGKGASEKRRTIFAVGDEKQSIFSFQGADPARFAEERAGFQSRIAAAGQELLVPRLNESYRSVPAVLGAVDLVFKDESRWQALGGEEPLHEAIRKKAPGRVEIWPCMAWGVQEEDESAWQKPLDSVPESSSHVRLANAIAKAIHEWKKDGGLTVGEVDRITREEKSRPVRDGDIIILVQKRGPLFDTILRTLKGSGIRVAGADRLQLTEHIAVMDLMALGDALLLESDDLQLACALKSPLFGFSDDDLFALAHERKSTLIEALRTSSAARYREAAALLDRWRQEARHLKPFDFYSRVLGRDGGRNRMIARLGEEAADALDEFLSRALGYEALETPSLQGFLGFLRRAGAEVKRDLEAGGDAVRVMTVHGVKGLEAPVVILAETTAVPAPQNAPKLVRAGGDNGAFVWATGNKTEASLIMEAAKIAAGRKRSEEYERLLYVALTRAKDVLVVCGALKKNRDKAEEGSWFDLVWNALAEDQHARPMQAAYHPEKIILWGQPLEPLPRAEDTPRSAQALPDTPWLHAKPSAPVSRRRVLRPSHLLETESSARERIPPREKGGLARGILVHRLLQSLPSLPPAERQAAGRRYLAAAAAHLDEAARELLLAESLAVIAHPLCAELFGAGSRAEAECVARIVRENETLEIPARIDRLLVTATQITLADFKSDQRIPDRADAVPTRYQAQLAAYREAMRAAFPGRAVRCILIYTGGPRVIEVPESALDSAWAKVQAHGGGAFS
ncbi:MAG: double-strand break repair helicase AddA [Xanthobacteraceae bacterium]|nr:double-strand break repair helicase AddA [Xanthobacteraceae bacterium]QYK45075.1 MAG: double-strand break repair helicase AddA [Xanthobacteraceae bacterium]